jgi:hypothetical protein
MKLEPGLQAASRVHSDRGRHRRGPRQGRDAGIGHPRVLALAERPTVPSVAGALAAGATTVGSRVELD